MKKISVVVCCLNEEKRIKNCLTSIKFNYPDEIIIVDGGSTDNTIEIAKNFTDKIFQNKNSNLTKDRQFGIDQAKNNHIVMIDSDHILSKNDLQNLLIEFEGGNYDILQTGLISNSTKFWNKCEASYWDLFHNNPTGERDMIGTAPAIYNKDIFSKVRFEDKITTTIDDTDFIYRLKKNTNFKIGISNIKIIQDHDASLKKYIKKFYWYGIGDGEFIKKNKNRTNSMIYHLLIRYPIIYTFKGILNFEFKIIPFVIIQGITRLIGLLTEILRK